MMAPSITFTTLFPFGFVMTWLRDVRTITVLGLGLILALFQTHACAQSNAGAVPSDGALEKVIVGKPSVKSLKWYSQQPAKLMAIEQTPIFARLSGYIQQVHVDYGDRVKKGDRLITIDVPELDAERRVKEAEVKAAESGITQAKASVQAAVAAVESAQALMRQAQAGVARSEADRTRWQIEFKRYEGLAKSGSVNRQILEETEQRWVAAKASYDEAVLTVQSREAVVAQAQASIAQAEADLAAAMTKAESAKAALAYTTTMLGYREIKAPFDGVVTRRDVDTGHYVIAEGSGQRPLLTVVRTDVLRAMIAIPEVESIWVELGTQVTLHVPALRGLEIPGQVSRTSWALSDENRVLETMLELKNDEGKLRPGMYATAKVLLAARENVMTLPAAAVVQRDGQAFCYRIINGKTSKSLLSLGIRVADDWEILQGIESTQDVALNKAASLKDDQPIDAVGEVKR